MFRAKTCAPRGTDLSIHYKGARCSFIMNNVLLPPGVQAVLDFLQKRDIGGAFFLLSFAELAGRGRQALGSR